MNNGDLWTNRQVFLNNSLKKIEWNKNTPLNEIKGTTHEPKKFNKETETIKIKWILEVKNGKVEIEQFNRQLQNHRAIQKK